MQEERDESLTQRLIRDCGWSWLAEQTADHLADVFYETGRPPTAEELLQYWRWLGADLD